ncbi:MAG: outer membrane beta-barrel protein [Ignavibacteria bacterium]|nr:outer membrane beta-barrel protein [Ignavibacteria bacterium]
MNWADFELPTALSLGLSYDFRLDKTNNLMLHGTFQNNSFATDDYNFGLEYNYNKLIYLRGGYQITNDTQDDRLFTGPSFGAGFNYNASSSFNIGFDYAYRVTDKFDANQFFTILLGF